MDSLTLLISISTDQLRETTKVSYREFIWCIYYYHYFFIIITIIIVVIVVTFITIINIMAIYVDWYLLLSVKYENIRHMK